MWLGALTRDALRRFCHERLTNVADPDEADLLHFEEEQGNGQGCKSSSVTKALFFEELLTNHSSLCSLPSSTRSYLSGSICPTLTGFVRRSFVSLRPPVVLYQVLYARVQPAFLCFKVNVPTCMYSESICSHLVFNVNRFVKERLIKAFVIALDSFVGY